MSRQEKRNLDERRVNPPRVPLPPALWRQREIRRLRARLMRDGFPRIEMMLLVALTGGVGLLASWGLRLAGLHAMGPRYALALLLAYAVFLALLRIWLRLRPSDHVDVGNVDGSWSPSSGGDPGTFSGGGGEFGGGGASGSFDVDADVDADALPDVGNVLDAGDAGEGCLIVVPLASLAVIVLSALTVVWSAPTLFAEVLLDTLLAAGLYRRLKHAPAQDWLVTALRRTAGPFAIAAVLVVGGGFLLQHLAPGADTLGAALELLAAD